MWQGRQKFTKLTNLFLKKSEKQKKKEWGAQKKLVDGVPTPPSKTMFLIKLTLDTEKKIAVITSFIQRLKNSKSTIFRRAYVH